VTKRIRVRFGDVVAEGTLDERRVPRTVAALWAHLPFRDRAISSRWSGDLWRTEGDHDLGGRAWEDPAGQLEAGDIIYASYAGADGTMKCRLGVAWAPSRWMEPLWKPGSSTVIGKIDVGLAALVTASERLIYEVPPEIELTRIEE